MNFLRYLFCINQVEQNIEPDTNGIFLKTVGYYKREIVFYSKINVEGQKIGKVEAIELKKAKDKVRAIVKAIKEIKNETVR